MGNTIGTTHIKTAFSLLPGTGKHFIGNALCRSDDSVTNFIYILHFFMINNAFYKPPKEIIKKIWRTRWQGMGSPFPNQQPGNSLSRKARTRREK
jgi:hypothetical protein